MFGRESPFRTCDFATLHRDRKLGVHAQYRRTASGFENLPQRNVNFAGGLERP